MSEWVAPLEHVLRNAIDHGVEDEQERKALGKPEMGAIRLNIRREGGDVVLELSDDGKGVDVAAVKERKPLLKVLMDSKDELSDEEIMRFIFAAGFSTAKELTQPSGRGVGMDVVQSEISASGWYGRNDLTSTARHNVYVPFAIYRFDEPCTLS